MGADFAALLRYRGPRPTESAIRDLEQRSLPEMVRVREAQVEYGHAYDEAQTRTTWIERWGEPPIPRPSLPSRTAMLYTLEGFFLTFAEDAAQAYHPLRWLSFLQDPQWQPVMLDACTALARHLGATEYVVTRDESPLMLAFFDGAGYREAIEHAIAAGETEAHDLMDMYIEIDDSGTWDSRGFLRVRLDASG